MEIHPQDKYLIYRYKNKIELIYRGKDMNVDTDWKLIFVLEFVTVLFELKLLRPAFVPLFALLPTISVFFKQ